MRIPLATYRLQFNGRFRFQDALGVTDIYASPLLQARTGSTHGYDVTDPTRLNRELGSERDFEHLARELGRRGIGLLLDIVPNHMAADPGTERRGGFGAIRRRRRVRTRESAAHRRLTPCPAPAR